MKKYTATWVIAVALCQATPSFAQNDSRAAAEEEGESESGVPVIVVTAQRREQSLNDVPISISVLDAKQITAAGFSNSLSIGDYVPNVEFKTFAGVPNIFIRGVGNNDFNSSSVGPISIYRDDVVVASTGGQAFALFDLERIEVLRGPQGTLFGKNTTGGAIQYISRQPGDEFEGYAKVGYGRFDLVEAEGAATIPFGDGLSMRFSGLLRRRDGERLNLATGEDAVNIDESAIRTILRYNPDSAVDIRLSGGYGRDRSDYHQPKPLGTINGADAFGYSDPAPDDIRILNFDGASRTFSDNYWVSLNASFELGDDLTLRSITGYDEAEVDNRLDVDGSPLRLDQIAFLTETDQFSQELQLLFEGNGFNALLGAYYFQESLVSHSETDAVGEVPFGSGAIPLITDSARDNESVSIFGQTTFDVTDRLSLTGGLRYTWDEVTAEHRGFLVPNFFDPATPNGPEIDLVPFGQFNDTFKAFSWRVAADYNFSDEILGFATVNRGFKSGGFNIGLITSLAERTQVEPEFLTAYELGVKATLFDRRAQLNISAFYYDYTDLQVLSVNQQAGTVPTLGLDNAADAEIMGLEFELFTRPTDTLDFGLNFGILDATFQNYRSGAIDPATGQPRDFSGNRLPGAPKFTLSTFVQNTFPVNDDLDFTLRAEYNYTGKKFYSNSEEDVLSSREGYGLVNLRASLNSTDDAWQISAWARNVFGKDYLVDATDLRDFGFIPLYYGERGTWGFDVTFRF
ncbi:TonB-dependent receptor domain-containing protein [Sphingorhabdus sp. Alg231-15]|uniref:TonB-dependent receptor domain-containing protein n=1 Tax=Sphingorhabdus sp. Alg231-15 TaxID=1922222 RepID=UPI000D54D9C5